MQKTISKERVFSIELKSKRNLKNLTLTNGGSDTVLLEGTLGGFVQAMFTEGMILEVLGENGVLRVDLKADEIRKARQRSSSEVKQQ
jgi:hypothetical protein